jgi:hypothetical protein
MKAILVTTSKIFTVIKWINTYKYMFVNRFLIDLMKHFHGYSC